MISLSPSPNTQIFMKSPTLSLKKQRVRFRMNLHDQQEQRRECGMWGKINKWTSEKIYLLLAWAVQRLLSFLVCWVTYCQSDVPRSVATCNLDGLEEVLHRRQLRGGDRKDVSAQVTNLLVHLFGVRRRRAALARVTRSIASGGSVVSASPRAAERRPTRTPICRAAHIASSARDTGRASGRLGGSESHADKPYFLFSASRSGPIPFAPAQLAAQMFFRECNQKFRNKKNMSKNSV